MLAPIFGAGILAASAAAAAICDVARSRAAMMSRVAVQLPNPGGGGFGPGIRGAGLGATGMVFSAASSLVIAVTTAVPVTTVGCFISLGCFAVLSQNF